MSLLAGCWIKVKFSSAGSVSNDRFTCIKIKTSRTWLKTLVLRDFTKSLFPCIFRILLLLMVKVRLSRGFILFPNLKCHLNEHIMLSTFHWVFFPFIKHLDFCTMAVICVMLYYLTRQNLLHVKNTVYYRVPADKNQLNLDFEQ